jgi:hypothetical protein
MPETNTLDFNIDRAAPLTGLELFLVQMVWMGSLATLRKAGQEKQPVPKDVWKTFWDLHAKLGSPPMPALFSV